MYTSHKSGEKVKQSILSPHIYCIRDGYKQTEKRYHSKIGHANTIGLTHCRKTRADNERILGE